MGDVIRFKKANPKERLKEKAKAVTLCRHGHHKWAIDPKKQFDVKSGKLVTLYRCQRCDTTKTTLT